MLKEHEGHHVFLGVNRNHSMRQFYHCRLFAAVMLRIRIVVIHILFPDLLHGAFGIRITHFKLMPPRFRLKVLPMEIDRYGLKVRSCLILKAFIKGKGAEI
jgi:hypothetical protein